MVLSSQMARQTSVRRYSGERSGMSRRRRRRRRTARLSVLILLLGGVSGWWFFRGGEDAPEAEAPAQAGVPGGGEAEGPPLAALPETDRPSTEAPATGATPLAATNGGARHASTDEDLPLTLTMGAPLEPALSGSDDSTLGDLIGRAGASEGASRPPAQSPGPDSIDAPQETGAGGPISRMIEQAERLAASNRPLEARGLLNAALHDRRAGEGQRALLRRRLSALNETLFFSPAIVPGDPLVERYTVQPGDALSKIARREASVDWTFLMRINEMRDPRSLRVGQTLKVVTAPIHAVVDKSDFRLDLYAGQPPRLVDGRIEIPSTTTYITSFDVGLGEYGSTPTGAWIVNDTKVVNPSWKNPRTGEYFSRDDPDNPVGERWVGLTGTDEQTQVMTGYGIHGTIEPDSIGQERSMGCVRLLPGQIEVVYEVMSPDESVVLIVD